MSIEAGMTHQVSTVVTDDITASLAKSGSLPVLATPFMIALMEQAAAELCQKEIEEGFTTVGISINISHLAATAVGVPVKAVATVTKVEDRKISFKVDSYDNAGLIGSGTHDRFIINCDKFMKKAYERSKQ